MGLSERLRLKLSSVAVVVVLVGMVASLADAQENSCANKLVPCASYLNSTTPPPACCNPLKETVTNDLDCLCTLYNTPGFLENLGLNITQALRLTQACGVPADRVQCNATGPSPQSVPPPPGVPGSDAQMIVWTGIYTLLIFLASMMFY
ncbi:non-specific lipid transfer protein GPI-anchored 7 [Ziziphus jujuba]|uniref:Non-specific lipid transfer protein GPI-anchored 7 n=1 Tax=Ziziphus jujuba TaxID=326968 RepID=A0A6P4B3H5_ZIZJJ|nr:non-specific lipid transfer protein GPI-anchored 7 [Ziziphus jujuba]